MLHDTKGNKAKTGRVLDDMWTSGVLRNDFMGIIVLLHFEIDYHTTSDYIGQTLRDREASRFRCLLK